MLHIVHGDHKVNAVGNLDQLIQAAIMLSRWNPADSILVKDEDELIVTIIRGELEYPPFSLLLFAEEEEEPTADEDWLLDDPDIWGDL